MASSIISHYNIVADNDDDENGELIQRFIDELHRHTELWGFKDTDEQLGRSWFEQLRVNLESTNVAIVVILPNHDQRNDRVHHACETALMQTFNNKDKCVIPIYLNGGSSQHFERYIKLEFRDETDWERPEKWLKLKKALEERCRPSKNDADVEADAIGVSPAPDESSMFFTDTFFERISEKIGVNWWKLGIRLGLVSNSISEIESNNRGHLSARITSMLRRWKRSLNTDCEHECVSILCRALRAETINDLANDIHNNYKEFSRDPSTLKTNPAEIDKSTPNDIFLLELAGKLSDSPRYCRSLGVDDTRLQCLTQDYEGDTHRQAFQALIIWRSQAGDLSNDAKIDRLVEVFRQERFDVVEWIKGQGPMSLSSDDWKICFQRNTEDGAQKLLACDVILDQYTLEFACNNLGRNSKAIKAVCDRICALLKRQPGVTQAWPAYAYRKGNAGWGGTVTFIVVTTNIERFHDEGYKCHVRSANEIDNKCVVENKKIKQDEMDGLWLMGSLHDVQMCINMQSSEFMAKHKHCWRITPSALKSIGYKTDNPKVFKQKCIALYVRIKGYIPLDEEPFPLKIGNFDVDVREGVCC